VASFSSKVTKKKKYKETLGEKVSFISLFKKDLVFPADEKHAHERVNESAIVEGHILRLPDHNSKLPLLERHKQD